jgi:FixJ family two-component response regulator
MQETPLIPIVVDDESVREARKGLMRAFWIHRRDVRVRDVAMQMPGMTGLDLHGRLIASGKSIPTILITACPDDGVRARALKAGATLVNPWPTTDIDALAID